MGQMSQTSVCERERGGKGKVDPNEGSRIREGGRLRHKKSTAKGLTMRGQRGAAGWL